MKHSICEKKPQKMDYITLALKFDCCLNNFEGQIDLYYFDNKL